MTFCKWNLAAYKFLVVFCYCCCYDLLENSFACVIFLPLGFFFLLLFPLFWVVPLMRFHLWIVCGYCFEEWLFGFNIQQTPIIWHRLFLHKWSVFILWLQTHSLTPEVSLAVFCIWLHSNDLLISYGPIVCKLSGWNIKKITTQNSPNWPKIWQRLVKSESIVSFLAQPCNKFYLLLLNMWKATIKNITSKARKSWAWNLNSTMIKKLRAVIVWVKLFNFANWFSGEVSKIRHHFRKKRDLKIVAIKKCQ